MNTKTYKEWWDSIDDYLAHMLMKEGYDHNKVYNLGITELRAAGEEDKQMTMDEFAEFICHKTGITYFNIKRNLMKANSSRKITSAKDSESANEDDVRQIALFIENDEQLYKEMIVPVIKNLERKINKGNFDKEKALIAWQNIADEGTKRYNKKHGSGQLSLIPFNTATRKEVAKQLMEHYEENYMGDNPITSSKENKAKENGPHMKFKKLDPDKEAELREQIEDELEARLNKLHVKFDVDTWNNTVEYILSFFEEDNGYNPKDAKTAVYEWYLDTKEEFPEMFEQDVKKKRIASALYNTRIQGKLIGNAKKPIKSSKSFTKDGNWKYNTAVLPSSKSILKSFFEDGSWSWDDTVALVGHINGGRPYVIFGAAGKYPNLEKGRGLFHDQTLNDIGWFIFERYCNDDSVFNIPQARYAVLK